MWWRPWPRRFFRYPNQPDWSKSCWFQQFKTEKIFGYITFNISLLQLSTFHCCRMLSQLRVALQWCRLQLPLVALLWFIFPLVVLSSPHFRPRLSQSCRSLRSRWSLRSRFPMAWLGGRPSFLFRLETSKEPVRVVWKNVFLYTIPFYNLDRCN